MLGIILNTPRTHTYTQSTNKYWIFTQSLSAVCKNWLLKKLTLLTICQFVAAFVACYSNNNNCSCDYNKLSTLFYNAKNCQFHIKGDAQSIFTLIKSRQLLLLMVTYTPRHTQMHKKAYSQVKKSVLAPLLCIK